VFAVLMPVGPGQREVLRVGDTLESLRAFEASGDIHLVLVDDSPTPRDLSRYAGVAGWASLELVRTHVWRGKTPDPFSAMVAGTMEGMRAAARKRPEFLLKLDTDALIVGPVADKLRRVFEDDHVGMVGSYTHTCTGDRRDWRMWEKKLRRAARTVAPSRRQGIRLRSPRAASAVRGLTRAARRNGYEWGAHCLGGAYAAGPRLLAREDLLEWRPWVRTAISEDVVVGLLSFASGLRIRGNVGPGETFAVGWKELPLPPEQIVARDYSVVHTVKDQVYGDEAELRAHFRGLRGPRG
jgi:hypothetical protein